MFLDKPIANTISDGRAITEVCRKAGVILALGYQRRRESHFRWIKQQIAAVKADKSAPEAQKKEDLAQLEAALKNAKPIQFKENIALVLKYFDKLTELMQEQGPGD